MKHLTLILAILSMAFLSSCSVGSIGLSSYNPDPNPEQVSATATPSSTSVNNGATLTLDIAITNPSEYSIIVTCESSYTIGQVTRQLPGLHITVMPGQTAHADLFIDNMNSDILDVDVEFNMNYSWSNFINRDIVPVDVVFEGVGPVGAG